MMTHTREKHDSFPRERRHTREKHDSFPRECETKSASDTIEKKEKTYSGILESSRTAYDSQENAIAASRVWNENSTVKFDGSRGFFEQVSAENRDFVSSWSSFSFLSAFPSFPHALRSPAHHHRRRLLGCATAARQECFFLCCHREDLSELSLLTGVHMRRPTASGRTSIVPWFSVCSLV